MDGVGSSDITRGRKGESISTGARCRRGGDRPVAVTARSIDFNARPLVKCHLEEAGCLWINHLKVHSPPRLYTLHPASLVVPRLMKPRTDCLCFLRARLHERACQHGFSVNGRARKLGRLMDDPGCTRID